MLRVMPTDGGSQLSPGALLRVIGTTDMLPSEKTSASGDPWIRALALADAHGRVLASSLGSELGRIQEIVQLPSPDSALVVQVTYLLAENTREAKESAGPADDILKYVPEQHRALYASFREQVLSLDPHLEPAPAPLRKGRRRYEGFRMGPRRIIYAGFRAKGISLKFELPKGQGHDPVGDDIEIHGKRSWRVVLLTSSNQLKGAVSLAEDTARAFKT
jgi:hypothetical protein